MNLLEIENLSLFNKEKTLLSQFDFTLRENTIHTIIGSSGSGKTSFLNLLLGLIPTCFEVSYDKFNFFGKDFKTISENEWIKLRGSLVSYIPQSPSRVFHPYIKIGNQILDFLKLKKKQLASKKKILELFEEIQIRDFERKFDLLPKNLSGGEKQRIIIKLASILETKLILADEPTTALDSINEKQILEMLLKFAKNSMVFITHDMRIVKEISDDVTVIKSGRIMEKITLLNQNLDKFQSKYSLKLILK